MQIDRCTFYGFESLLGDLCGVLDGHGSSCGDEWGTGWVPAVGEAHELAGGCCGLGCRAARGSMHSCLGAFGAHLELPQHARCARGPFASSVYRGA